MGVTNSLSINTASYSGNIDSSLFEEACLCFQDYAADKEKLVTRLLDNEKIYRSWYEKLSPELNKKPYCTTSFIFSSIENAKATASENFPSADILERSEDGTAVAETLSKIIPVIIDESGFRKTYKNSIGNKLKYGTVIFSVIYNEDSGSVDIKTVDLLDFFVDYNISDIQDSKFIFVVSSVDNDLLRYRFPDYADFFSGDTDADTLTGSVRLHNRSSVVDCYYKRPDGSVHFFKVCNSEVIQATEDMPGYDKGLYNHGMYPFVADVMYPVDHCPFGFGMIDIAKSTQFEINKLDKAITSLILMASKPRYLAKRNSDIDNDQFFDLSTAIVEYEGDPDSLLPIGMKDINQYYSVYRDTKKDELKELLGNRDFTQGSTSGGVTSGTAISILQQSGEKRSRMMFDDSYIAFERICSMILEFIRQFYTEKRVFRTVDEFGQKNFISFSNELLFKHDGFEKSPLEFDIKVTAQKANPFSAEALNQLIFQFWTSGMLAGDNLKTAITIIRNMQFDGRDSLVSDLERLLENETEAQQTAAQPPATDAAAAMQSISVPAAVSIPPVIPTAQEV